MEYAGYGEFPYGEGGYGFGSATEGIGQGVPVGEFGIERVRLADRRNVLVEFSQPPQRQGPDREGDAFNPDSWTVFYAQSGDPVRIAALSSSHETNVVRVKVSDPLERVDGDLLAFGAPLVRSSAGLLISLPYAYVARRVFVPADRSYQIVPLERNVFVDLLNSGQDLGQIEGAPRRAGGSFVHDSGLRFFEKIAGRITFEKIDPWRKRVITPRDQQKIEQELEGILRNRPWVRDATVLTELVSVEGHQVLETTVSIELAGGTGTIRVGNTIRMS